MHYIYNLYEIKKIILQANFKHFMVFYIIAQIIP